MHGTCFSTYGTRNNNEIAKLLEKEIDFSPLISSENRKLTVFTPARNKMENLRNRILNFIMFNYVCVLKEYAFPNYESA